MISMTQPGPTLAAETAKHVLVVDDVPEICAFFESLVQRIRGLDVRLTIESDPARGLERLRERPYDLVVSDFRMGEVDGIRLLRESRALNPGGRRILMTGYNEIPAPVSQIREANVDAYIQKPLRSQDLLLLLCDFLRGDPDVLEVCKREARHIEAMGEREEAA